MKRLLLKNNHHHTETYVIPKQDKEGGVYVTGRQLLIATKKLCGKNNCQCGGVLEIKPKIIHNKPCWMYNTRRFYL